MRHSNTIKVILAIWISLLQMSCSSSSKIAVSSVTDTRTLQPGSFIYAIPVTVMDVLVKAEQVTVVPGPYYQYAEKYLGITDVPEKTESYWYIREMVLSSHTEADPDYLFSVTGISEPDAYPGIADLLHDGLILSAKDFSHDQFYNYSFPPEKTYHLYTDLSVKRNFEAEKDVDVSLVMPGSEDNTRQTSRNTLKEKTTEQKAEEAANFLIKLKKRRFKLVTGQNEFTPQDQAMKEALQELARLEETYLSLFIGKRIATPHQKSYSFTPVTGKETDRVVLFRLSESAGFADAREADGIPVVLELEDNNKTRVLEQYRIPLKPIANQLHYRIPDQMKFRLMAGEQIWAEATCPVFQCGAIVPLKVGK